jgi:hypothetical protein
LQSLSIGLCHALSDKEGVEVLGRLTQLTELQLFCGRPSNRAHALPLPYMSGRASCRVEKLTECQKYDLSI